MSEHNRGDSEYRFLVAFSFAGEQRMEYVRPLAEALREKLGDGRVFLDEWYTHEISSLVGDDVLAEVYREQSLLIIPCVSEEYGNKAWTQMEFAAIKGLIMALRNSGDRKLLRILPLRVGGGDVPGIYENATIQDIREIGHDGAVDLIWKRLAVLDVDLNQLPRPWTAHALREEIPSSEPEKEVKEIYTETSSVIDEIFQRNETVRVAMQSYFPTMLTESDGRWELAK